MSTEETIFLFIGVIGLAYLAYSYIVLVVKFHKTIDKQIKEFNTEIELEKIRLRANYEKLCNIAGETPIDTDTISELHDEINRVYYIYKKKSSNYERSFPNYFPN